MGLGRGCHPAACAARWGDSRGVTAVGWLLPPPALLPRGGIPSVPGPCWFLPGVKSGLEVSLGLLLPREGTPVGGVTQLRAHPPALTQPAPAELSGALKLKMSPLPLGGRDVGTFNGPFNPKQCEAVTATPRATSPWLCRLGWGPCGGHGRKAGAAPPRSVHHRHAIASPTTGTFLHLPLAERPRPFLASSSPMWSPPR